MDRSKLDPELVKRLRLVEEPTYEGESLTQMDIILLTAAGIVFPFALMLWGWGS